MTDQFISKPYNISSKSLILYIKKAILFWFFLFPVIVFSQDTTWFKDVGVQVGFKVFHAGGFIAVDVNNDDYPDLITMYGDTSWRLMINMPDPKSSNPKDRIFVDETKASGINNIFPKGIASAGDFNNDGNVDIVTNCWWQFQEDSANYLVPRADNGSRCHLLLGDGKGHFTLKANSGLEDLGPMPGGCMPLLDFDKDGNLDLFIANHYFGWFNTPGPSYLMKGNGDGTFTNVTAPPNYNGAGINVSEKDPAKPWLNPPQFRAIFGANVGDWNNDCNQDIFTAPYEATGYNFQAKNGQEPTAADTENTAGYCQLFKNNGNGTFTDVGVSANLNSHFKWGNFGQGMVPWAVIPADYDNDGDMDFFILEVHGGNNPGEGRSTIFTNQGAANNYALLPDYNKLVRKAPSNIHHGDHNGDWIDFDNDGWTDVMVGDAVYVIPGYPDYNRMALCRQDPTTHIFTDITKNLGFITGNTISPRIKHPSTMLHVDYDLDGDDDIIKVPYNSDDSTNFLVLRNDIANKSNYIQIRLVAPKGVNKSCIGARVVVKAGSLKQMKDIYAEGGQGANQSPFILDFGLGTNTTIDSIDVRWPNSSCSHTVLTNIPANQSLKIDEDGIYTDIPDFSGDFLIYPNPIENDMLNIAFKSSFTGRVEVYNAAGKKVDSFEYTGSTTKLEVPLINLAAGVYWVRMVNSSDGHTMSKSFLRIKTN